MNKKHKKILVILMILPVLFYLALVGLVELDRVTNQLVPNNLPSLTKTSRSEHKMVLMNYGLASFWKRLDLIRNAKKSIELEYFIYDLDQSSRILTKELMRKSKQGVKVRIIVDFSLPVFKLNPNVAAFLIKSGIEVKYYNTAKAYNLFNVQHRSHRKLLIVDDEFVVTGGRNIADDYFEVSSHYNFFDSDLLVSGEIVKSILDSYNVYWNSELAVSAQTLKTKFSEDQLMQALQYLENNHEDDQLVLELEKTGKELFDSSLQTKCDDITFATDHPGSSIGQRKVYEALINESSLAQDNILVESPYFVLRSEGMSEIKKMIDRGVKFKVLTNSLRSTDAYYTVAALATTLRGLFFSGIELWAYNGTPRAEQYLIKNRKTSERWGLHAKRGVIDNSTTLLGTYNIDPRSANLNSELMIICRNNSELAEAVKKDIEAKISLAEPVVKDGCIKCSLNLIKDADLKSKIKFFLTIPVSNLLDFLL